MLWARPQSKTVARARKRSADEADDLTFVEEVTPPNRVNETVTTFQTQTVGLLLLHQHCLAQDPECLAQQQQGPGIYSGTLV